MEQTVFLQSLIQRPIIRNNKPFEYLNKMTNEEIKIFDEESLKIVEEQNPDKKDIGIKLVTREIDLDVIYKVFKLANE